MPEIERKSILSRKTFAIISHPDAGKTTLTEKFLLFGGAIQEAGAVKSNKIKKSTSSDFMEIERQRGISVTTSVLTFEYKHCIINLLDTPGHKDFAEDTYRTLSAVDSVIVVIDSVKGVEPQTIKLMEVCRLRKMPTIVFINKIDRDGKDLYDLLDEVENILKIKVCPHVWPINTGRDLKGIYHLNHHHIKLIDNKTILPYSEFINQEKHSSPKERETLEEDKELLKVYGDLDKEAYLNGEVAPIFFGSALNNFGVEEVLNYFVELAPSPHKKETDKGFMEATNPSFSGFVFKIHANIDPKHRDRIAFLRICSGVFERSKTYFHVRTEKKIRFNNPYSFFGKDKSIVEKAYPGDVVGLYDTNMFKIGDTITDGEKLNFIGIPSFSPEIFREVINKNPLKTKQLEKGVKQLTDEGVAQLFTQTHNNKKIIGCVGELQFEVIKYRLLQEYGASCDLTPLRYYKALWIKSDHDDKIGKFIRFKTDNIALDKNNHFVYLAPSKWYQETEQKNNPDIQFIDIHEEV